MKKLILLIIFFVFFIVGCNSNAFVVINGEKVNVEVAKTVLEKQEGLMFRTDLCVECGMLFLFENEVQHPFWMKNTLIPLDMVFINSDLKIVDLVHAIPCEKEPCKSYVSKNPASYVLEVNSGIFNEGIIGEKAKISY